MHFSEYELSILSSEETTGSYTASQFNRMTSGWDIRMYLTKPGSEEPLDELGEPLIYPAKLSADELFNNLLKKHSGAWRRLSEM